MVAQRAECYQLQDLRLSFWSLRLRGGFLFESVLPKANNTGYLPLIPWGPTLLLTQCPSAWKSLDGALYSMTLKFPSKLDMLCPSALLFLHCKARSFWGCTPNLLPWGSGWAPQGALSCTHLDLREQLLHADVHRHGEQHVPLHTLSHSASYPSACSHAGLSR